MNVLPVTSGESQGGVELWLPLLDWSHAAVFDYLRSKGVELPRLYEHSVNSFECARCSAWWGERRAAYLQRYHPALFVEYRERMRAVLRELHRPMAQLADEVAALGGARSMLEVADG